MSDFSPDFVRGFNNYDTKAASDEAGTPGGGEGEAQQQFKEEVDINTIVKRFGLTGVMPESPVIPMSGDFENVVDYQTALNAVNRAREGFMELTAEVRSRFYNDPQKLMEFMEDPRNHSEAVRLGLVNPPKEVTRDVVVEPVGNGSTSGAISPK